jgi:membrane-associated phospholipid phosphatase
MLRATLGLMLAFTLSAPAARADDAEPPGDTAPKHRMTWTYPRFRTVEYVTALALTGAGLWLETGTRGFPENHIGGPVLLDQFSRDALVLGSESSRLTAANISDVVWPITQYFPIVDSLVTPLLTDRGNFDVATQMTLINWQVQGVAFLLTRTTHRIAGRARPVVYGCGEDSSWDSLCGDDEESLRASFLSGHASMSFASAGLTCSHHISLPMYGGNAADAAICAVSLTSATAVAVMRVMADKHWWSDVVAGSALGLATGFGLPFLLHYAHGVSPEFLGGQRVVVLPLASDTVAGVSVGAVGW